MVSKKNVKIIVHRISNEEVLRRVETGRKLCVKIRERQVRFFGHVMKRDGLENIIMTGMMKGKKSRGRQRVKHLDGLKMWFAERKYIAYFPDI